jgi:hypothetical protein
MSRRDLIGLLSTRLMLPRYLSSPQTHAETTWQSESGWKCNMIEFVKSLKCIGMSEIHLMVHTCEHAEQQSWRG